MLLQKSRNKKSIQSADSIFKKGLLLLQDKLYKQAMIELKIALEHNPLTVRPELESLFEKYEEGDNVEIALTIGLVLFQVKREEKLAIKLGNYSRQLGNYKQANNLYRQALKINRNSITAFYNLAASMGHVDWYDEDIVKNIRQYFTVKDYVLPEYVNNNNSITEVKNQLERFNLESKTEEVQNLNAGITEKQSDGDYNAADKLKLKLDALINRTIEPKYSDIVNTSQKQIKRRLEEENDDGEKDKLYADIFNLGLFALRNRDVTNSLEYFLILKSNDIEMENLELGLALASAINGNKEEAIRILSDKIRFDRENRLLNINLALLHRRVGNKLLAYKYQIISAALLEKSRGYIYSSQILNKADFHFKQGKLSDALKLYEIVAYESNDVKAWLNIGEIHLLQKRQLEALDAFKQIQKLHPESPEVQIKLMEVHDIICESADELFNASKFSQAAVVYERALKLVRKPDTINRLISTYKRLNKYQLVQNLYEELQNLTVEKRAENEFDKRNQYLEKGKEYLRGQDFDSAILCFENAFNIEPDKDVFAYLAHLYKALQRKRMLRDLVQRWNAFKKKKASQSDPAN